MLNLPIGITRQKSFDFEGRSDKYLKKGAMITLPNTESFSTELSLDNNSNILFQHQM